MGRLVFPENIENWIVLSYFRNSVSNTVIYVLQS